MAILKELAVLADYDPRYWSFFRQRMINDPTPRMARWGYEAGVLSKAQLHDIVKRFGYTDKDAVWMTDMLAEFQERPYITRYLTALEAAYLKGVITAEELTASVTAIDRRPEIADWIIKTVDVRKKIADARPKAEKTRLLTVTDLKKAYIYGKLPETEFRTRLQLLGYDLLDIQLVIDIIEIEREKAESGGNKAALSVAEMLNAFKYRRIEEPELLTNLMQRGLNLYEAQLLIDTNKAKWGWIEDACGDEKDLLYLFDLPFSPG